MNLRKQQNSNFTLALFVLTVSGAAALAHQLLWTRRTIDLLGATTESSARVFGCFFLGLALGAAFLSGKISRVRRPWRVLASLELGIAILTIPILYLPHWTDWIWPMLGFSRVLGWQGYMAKAILSGMVVVPPAFLMGMTLPLALLAIAGREGTGNRHSVVLYAVNTLGGALGLAFAIGFLLPASGVFGAILTLMGLNIVLSGGQQGLVTEYWTDPDE